MDIYILESENKIKALSFKKCSHIDINESIFDASELITDEDQALVLEAIEELFTVIDDIDDTLDSVVSSRPWSRHQEHIHLIGVKKFRHVIDLSQLFP